jgi:hypothetical protein
MRAVGAVHPAPLPGFDANPPREARQHAEALTAHYALLLWYVSLRKRLRRGEP